MPDAQALRPAVRAGADALAPSVLVALTALLLSLTISGNLMFLVGIPYDAPGGFAAEKLHPATYCAVLALLLAAAERGWRVVEQCPAAWGFLALMLLCVVFQAATGGSERVVIYLESFLPAGALAIVFIHTSPEARRRLAWWLLLLLLLNVVIALAEALMQRQWIPVFLEDREMVVKDAEFRPTALYDHPLTGAMLSMIGLFLAAALPGWRGAMLMLAFSVGVLAFGGRAALATSLGVLGLLACRYMLRRLAAGKMRLRELGGLMAAFVLAATVAAVLLAATSVGARIAEHLYWDESAAARSVQWRVLGMLDTGEWLFGATRERVEQFVANLGLRYPFDAIENFWLLLFLDLGLFGFPLFLIGLVTLLLDGWRRAGGAGRLMLVSVMIVASTSNSLGRKSNILTVLIPAVIATTGFDPRCRDAR